MQAITQLQTMKTQELQEITQVVKLQTTQETPQTVRLQTTQGTPQTLREPTIQVIQKIMQLQIPKKQIMISLHM